MIFYNHCIYHFPNGKVKKSDICDVIILNRGGSEAGALQCFSPGYLHLRRDRVLTRIFQTRTSRWGCISSGSTTEIV